MTDKKPELPGMVGKGVEAIPGIPELDELAGVYVVKRDERMEKTPPEVEAKKALIKAIHDHQDKLPRNQKTGAIIYRNESLIIELTPQKEKLRVRGVKQEKAPEDSETETEE